MPLKMRYPTNTMYAAAKADTTQVNKSPLPSEEKKSSKRYPLITITKAATSHETSYKQNSSSVHGNYRMEEQNVSGGGNG